MRSNKYQSRNFFRRIGGKMKIGWKPDYARHIFNTCRKNPVIDLTELIEIAMASSFALGMLIGIAGMALFLEDQ